MNSDPNVDETKIEMIQFISGLKDFLLNLDKRTEDNLPKIVK